MWIDAIQNEAKRLKIKYQTADPYEICDALKIHLMLLPMGVSSDACKGFCLMKARCTTIVLNSEMPEEIRRIILAHELGHAVLHRGCKINAFHDYGMLDSTSKYEDEANIFAAEFLLTDEDLLNAADEGKSFYELACELGVPPDLLDFKIRLLHRAGYQLNIPYVAKSKFLKRDLTKPLW